MSGLVNRQLSLATPKSKVIIFTGGLNEQVTNIELQPGELVDCLNYVEEPDIYHGYTSAKGYERFDGQTAPSSSTVGANDDYTAVEAARADITAALGYGAITGIHYYNDTCYSFQNDASTATQTSLYRSSAAGWVEVTGLGNSGVDATIHAVNGRIATHNANAETMYWVDGVTTDRYWSLYNNTVTEHNPTADTGTTGEAPKLIGVWKNRIFLVYANGHVLFSAPGSAVSFSALDGAGEVFLGDEVTAVHAAPGGPLAFFTANSIHALYYGATSEVTDFIFNKEELNMTVGAIARTPQEMYGTLYFADDKGLTSLNAAAEFGDYAANSMGQKVKETFQNNKSRLQFSVVERTNNRYYLFFDDLNGTFSRALVYTFKDKLIKGSTLLRLNHKMTCVVEGKSSTGESRIFFGASNGMVYEFLKGTSFDGEVINTKFSTSFYHYGNNRTWCSFRRLAFEMNCELGTTINVHTEYDYADRQLPKPITISTDPSPAGGTWGYSLWGVFVWAAQALGKAVLYNYGMGTNMSVQVNTAEKYRQPHTFYNMTVDYIPNGMQQ